MDINNTKFIFRIQLLLRIKQSGGDPCKNWNRHLIVLNNFLTHLARCLSPEEHLDDVSEATLAPGASAGENLGLQG